MNKDDKKIQDDVLEDDEAVVTEDKLSDTEFVEDQVNDTYLAPDI